MNAERAKPRNARRTSGLALCVIGAFLLQVSVVPRFSCRSLRPDLLLLVAAFFALETDFKAALVGAFVLGALRDLGSGGPLGVSSLLLCPVVAGAVMLRESIRGSWGVRLAIAALLIVSFSLGENALLLLTGAPSLRFLLRQAAGQSVFTLALVPLLFPVLKRGERGKAQGAGSLKRSATAPPQRRGRPMDGKL